MGKFSGSRSDSLFGQLRHKNIRTRSQNYWEHKNKVTGNRPKTVDQKHKAGEALFHAAHRHARGKQMLRQRRHVGRDLPRFYSPPMQFFVFQRRTMTFVHLTRGR